MGVMQQGEVWPYQWGFEAVNMLKAVKAVVSGRFRSTYKSAYRCQLNTMNHYES